MLGYKEQHALQYRKGNTNLDLGCVFKLVVSRLTKKTLRGIRELHRM